MMTKPHEPTKRGPKTATRVLFLRIPKDLHERMVASLGRDPNVPLPPGRRGSEGGHSLNSLGIEVLEKAFPKEEDSNRLD